VGENPPPSSIFLTAAAVVRFWRISSSDPSTKWGNVTARKTLMPYATESGGTSAAVEPVVVAAGYWDIGLRFRVPSKNMFSLLTVVQTFSVTDSVCKERNWPAAFITAR
jgi:hypothetical protein